MSRGYMCGALTLSGSFNSFLDFDLLVPAQNKNDNTLSSHLSELGIKNHPYNTHMCHLNM